MKNSTPTALTSYFIQQRHNRILIETVKDSLAQTFAVRLIARMVLVCLAAALFHLASPTAGFITLAISIFIL